MDSRDRKRLFEIPAKLICTIAQHVYVRKLTAPSDMKVHEWQRNILAKDDAMSTATRAGTARFTWRKILRVFLWVLLGLAALSAVMFVFFLVKTRPAANVADRFYSHLSKANVSAAFELTSVKFRKTTNIEALNRAVSDHQLDKFKSVFWYERYINGTGDAAVVRLAGTLSRLDGSSTPVAMRFVWIGNWVIDEVEGAGFGVACKDRPANR